MNREITYFEKPGAANTDETVKAAADRAIELGVKHIVVASTTGSTGIKVAKATEGTDIKTIVVTLHYGAREEGKWQFDEKNLETLQNMGATVFTQTHALSGVERSFSGKLGGTSRTETMAADAGMVPVGDSAEIIAIGGTHSGADVACVIRPGHANSFFDMQIREIIAMPRLK